ncbi:MAG: hypothetical protein JST84_05195 [Acidobacteria bacterium]|nr:hypothetical protein [Acidobacteriota bacterium]
MKLLLLTTITLTSLLNRVPTAQDFFTGNWNIDHQKVTLIRDYMRQPEKPFGDFDCHCPQFAHEGKVVPTPAKWRPVIEQALQIHNSHTNVCFFKQRPTGIDSDMAGNVFVDVKEAEKLSPIAFLAVMGHELGHRYGTRVLQNYNEQDEYFADIVSAWTMIQVSQDPMTIATALYKLVPDGKGDKIHPSHKKRIQALEAIVKEWNSSLLIGQQELERKGTLQFPTQFHETKQVRFYFTSCTY